MQTSGHPNSIRYNVSPFPTAAVHMLRLVSMRGMNMRTGFVCIPMLVKSRGDSAAHTKKKLNATCGYCFKAKISCSFQWCTCFCSKSNILCAGKWIKVFTKTVFEFNLHFQHIGLTLQENQVHHSKERKLLV